MASATAFRSFAIALAIVIAIIEPHVSGFVIHQNNTREKKVLLPVKSVYGTHNMVKGEKGQGIFKSEKNQKFVTETITTESEGKTTQVSTNTERVTTDNALNPTISSDTIEVLDSTEVTRDNLPLLSDEKTSDYKHILEVTTSEKDKTVTTTDSAETVQFTTVTETTSEKQKNKNLITTPSSEKFSTASMNPSSTKSVLNTTLSSSLASEITTTDMDSVVIMNDQYYHEEVSTFSSENEPTSMDDDVTSSSVDINEITTEDAVATITTEPTRKKYITIERKRSEDSSKTTIQETINANMSYSNNSMEMASSTITTEGLRLDLLPHNKTEDALSAETAKATLSVQSTIPSINMISNDVKALNDDVKKSGAVVTRRGGFLNLSENTATEQYTPEVVETKRKPSGLERPRMGRISESQRQLAEDAIREEFLKEEAISNNEQNYKRYEGVRPLGDEAPSDAGAQSSGDSLSVQPINYDKNKTTLYTVSTNYKPMKKIDVQPAKPFLRDPDDNSWRNESISSLGIVFNPKNSSKSFKEVLKNKTQTELNNLQEKENKDDVPDLRVRLEKIAEVRKTKKKKTNKNGEVVYTDYEEASAENSKEAKTTESLVPKLEIPPLTTPTSITEPDQKFTTESNPSTSDTHETPSTSIIDSFFDRMRSLAPFTTQKAKAFNVAEYYDTTDEYDADYVTLSKIDLKKEFKLNPPRLRPRTTTQPSPTAPVKPYLLDRKPTVQYFPPLTTQRVNVNNVDRDFERKINMFTVKDQPQPERHEPIFITLPSLPIETDRDPRPTFAPPDRDLRPTFPLSDRDLRPTFPPTDLDPRPIFPLTDRDSHPAYLPTDRDPRPFFPPADRDSHLTQPPSDRDPRPLHPPIDVITLPPAHRDESPPTDATDTYLTDDENFRRGSYIIKHYRDYLAHAGNDDDDEEPPRPTTTTDAHKEPDFDYDAQFRREVLSRFIDNFNQNSERFKADFPVLYNSSVVHRQEEGGGVASSRAFMRRVYEPGTAAPPPPRGREPPQPPARPCTTECGAAPVELSAAYELYYVPEQEERAAPRAHGL